MESIKFVIEKSARIQKLIDTLYEKMPEMLLINGGGISPYSGGGLLR